MKARPGDHIIVKGHVIGETDREGEVLEAMGEGNQPPYRVRWEDGHESVFFPGPDAEVRKAHEKTH
ncbi:MAG: DUF1918 domain-containing protein [Acidimicrobiia bacterium]|nr:DUF1918 domain-containing protein [Acidimicrobiia bacterium]MDH4308996.1 DUF1918 domain-containing protein [Acidimicrobiia bacterium]